MLKNLTCCFGKQRCDGNTQYPCQIYTDNETETIVVVQLGSNSNKNTFKVRKRVFLWLHSIFTTLFLFLKWGNLNLKDAFQYIKTFSSVQSVQSLSHVRLFAAAAAAARSHQSCPTLCDPIDGSPPGSPIPGILQARTLEWVAISFSNAWEWKVKVKLLSHVRLLATPWTAAHQGPLSTGFSRQEYWSRLPFPSPIWGT